MGWVVFSSRRLIKVDMIPGRPAPPRSPLRFHPRCSRFVPAPPTTFLGCLILTLSWKIGCTLRNQCSQMDRAKPNQTRLEPRQRSENRVSLAWFRSASYGHARVRKSRNWRTGHTGWDIQMSVVTPAVPYRNTSKLGLLIQRVPALSTPTTRLALLCRRFYRAWW